MIEQAMFAYSPLENPFEKNKTKAIEYQGEKQINAIEDPGKQLDNERLVNKQLDNKQSGSNEFFLSKEREIFRNIYNKRLDKIDELSKKLIIVTWNSSLIVTV